MHEFVLLALFHPVKAASSAHSNGGFVAFAFPAPFFRVVATHPVLSCVIFVVVLVVAAVLWDLRRLLGETRRNQKLIVERRIGPANSPSAQELIPRLFHGSLMSAVVVDTAGNIGWMNQAAEQLTRFRRHELVKRHSILRLLDPEQVSAIAIELGRETGRPVSAGFGVMEHDLCRVEDRIWSLNRRDGTQTRLRISMTALRQDGTISGYLLLLSEADNHAELAYVPQRLLYEDALTGLPNLSHLTQIVSEHLEVAREGMDHLAVFVLELDRFSEWMGILGPLECDNVLMQVAIRLRRAVRASDVVARVGYDRFAVVLPGMVDSGGALTRATALLDSVGEPLHVGQHELRLTASLGYSIAPADADSPESLLQQATLALHAPADKDQGHKDRGRITRYSEELHQEVLQRLHLQADLRRAIELDQLVVHYQPKFSCATGRMTGVEALLRWRHPLLGLLSPDTFLPLVDEPELMHRIGVQTLRRACDDAVHLQAQLGRRVTMSVNLSPPEYRHPGLLDCLEDALATSGLPATDLELEITEQMLMSATPESFETVDRIRDLGVNLAIDDFGTGFSSFNYLLHFKVDRLKVDRSFVQRAPTDANAATIVRAIISMTHSMALDVSAEGVETEEQLAFLLEHQCDEVQGYLLSRAVARDELASDLAMMEARLMTMLQEWRFRPPTPQLALLAAPVTEPASRWPEGSARMPVPA